jgi:hypothetical protein
MSNCQTGWTIGQSKKIIYFLLLILLLKKCDSINYTSVNINTEEEYDKK